MQETDELLSKARALGEALAAHPTVQAYRAAQEAVRADESAQALLREYQAQAERIGQLEAEQKPVEVSDKHRLRECELKMASHAAMKQLMRVQADYIQLMAQINENIGAPLAGTGKMEGSA